MGIFSINGRSGQSVSVTGNNISVVNGVVIVDGKRVDMGAELENEKVFNIVVNGDAGDIAGEFATIEVAGNARSVKNTTGSIRVEGDVLGPVSGTQGSIRVGKDVTGNVTNTQGSVTVSGKVTGSVSTVMGNINR